MTEEVEVVIIQMLSLSEKTIFKSAETVSAVSTHRCVSLPGCADPVLTDMLCYVDTKVTVCI